jgi:zinc transport system substrate-binding protein
MKRIFAALAAIGIVLTLAACGKKSAAEQGGVKVVATIFPPYDFVRQIAGDAIAAKQVSLAMLLPPGAESHSFEPTPQDIIAIQKSDVFIYGGGESDAWVERILASLDTGGIKIVTLMDCVEVVEEEIVEGMENEDDAEEGEAEYDEHVWTSPRNAALIAEKIAASLCEVDAARAELYRGNASSYVKKLDALDAEFSAVVQGAKRRTLVFGDRFPFRYFADAYGLQYFAAFPGCSTETECSAATLAFLIDKVKAEKIPAVFHIELSNEKIADTIAEATGAKKLLLHSCHNLSKKDFEAGKTYLDFMQDNAGALREALY